MQTSTAPPSVVGPDMASTAPTAITDAPGRRGHTEQPVMTNNCPVLTESTAAKGPEAWPEESESHTI